DMAYTSRENMEAVVKAGGLPYFLFKSNSNGTGNGIVWHKMYQYLHDNPQEYLQHYHKRSNVESTFSMILRKFGTTLLTRKFTANINEILCKIICHNLCCLIAAYYELGIEKSFCTETYEKQKVSMKL
ncbi:MAG: hypothetical protein NTY48_05725, partial [Candidatus Diapherotrites archaeon]|nr:hypothetical protein [Candidatus Diapherotrites archaeon]